MAAFAFPARSASRRLCARLGRADEHEHEHDDDDDDHDHEEVRRRLIELNGGQAPDPSLREVAGEALAAMGKDPELRQLFSRLFTEW